MTPEERTRYNCNAALERLYGLTLEAYESMLAAQGGVCARFGGCSAITVTSPLAIFEKSRLFSTKRVPIWQNSRTNHLTRLIMLNSGIYKAITIPPTVAPMTAIRMGSIRLVREATAASTSWS
jgi:hypothetical protein